MPRIGAAGEAAAVDAVSGDGSKGGSDAVWQADSARQSADANGAMSDLDMVSYACAIFASGNRLAEDRVARQTVRRNRQPGMTVIQYYSSRSTSCARPFGQVPPAMRRHALSPARAAPVRFAADRATCATRSLHRCRARCLPMHRDTARV